MRRCFAFDETDTKLQLVDNRGCAIERLISDFTYDKNAGTAEATLYSMFRLPHSNRTYFQCDVLICRGKYLVHIIMNSYLFMYKVFHMEGFSICFWFLLGKSMMNILVKYKLISHFF